MIASMTRVLLLLIAVVGAFGFMPGAAPKLQRAVLLRTHGSLMLSSEDPAPGIKDEEKESDDDDEGFSFMAPPPGFDCDDDEECELPPLGEDDDE